MGLGNLNMEAFFLDNLNLEALRKREEYGMEAKIVTTFTNIP
jgi:hypothetical protein